MSDRQTRRAYARTIAVTADRAELGATNVVIPRTDCPWPDGAVEHRISPAGPSNGETGS